MFNKLGPKESISSLYSYYREASDKCLVISYVVLTLKYDNGSTRDVKLNDKDVKITGYNPNIVGGRVLVVGYIKIKEI